MSSSVFDYIRKNNYGVDTIKDIVLKKNEDLFLSFARLNSKANVTIENYNYMIDVFLKEKIVKLSFMKTDGTYVKFKDIEVEKPYIKKGEKKIPLFPSGSRKKQITYNGDVILTYDKYLVSKDKAKLIEENVKLNVGKMPIMLGSNRCHLNGLSPEELIRYNECPSDPFGYFIFKSERVIITQENTRTNFFVNFVEKNGVPVTRTTMPNPKINSRILEIRRAKYSGKIKMNMSSTRGSDRTVKNITIFCVYRFLGIKPEEAINMIIEYIPEQYKEICRLKLNETTIFTNTISDDFEYICRKMNKNVLHKDKNEQRKIITAMIIDDIFPNIYDEELELNESLHKKVFNDYDRDEVVFKKKMEQLSFMIARFLLFICDILPSDDRDSYSNKRFESAGIKLGSILIQYIGKGIMETLSSKNVPASNFDKVLSKAISDNLSKNLESNFNKSNNWGVTGGYKGGDGKGDNIVNTNERITPLKTMTISSKTSYKADSKNKNLDQRYIIPTQIDYSCVNQSPDSPFIGIVKFTCVTCKFSKGSTDDSDIYNFISSYNSHSKNENKKGKKNMFILLNGILVRDKNNKEIKVDENFKTEFIYNRRNGNIGYESEIFHDKIFNTFEIYTDASRPQAPYLIINEKTHKLVIDEKDFWDRHKISKEYNLDLSKDKDFTDFLLKNGCVEYLSARERDTEDITVCRSIEEFYKLADSEEGEEISKGHFFDSKDKYTHCRIHPLQLVGLCASLAPAANMQPAPRTNFSCGMVQQALCSGHSCHQARFDSSYKILYGTQRAYTEPITYSLAHMDHKPCGRMVMTAFYNHRGNQEDAIVLNRNTRVTYDAYETIVYNETQSPSGSVEKYCKPEDSPIFDAVDEDGMPIIGKFVKENQCVVGKITKYADGRTTYINSLFTKKGETGYITRVFITKDANTHSLRILIKLKQRRFYIIGDKMAMRYSQKGTIGDVLCNDEMIKVCEGPNKGLVPDTYFGCMGFPTRMTLNMLAEGIINKAAIYTGERVNFSNFNETEIMQKLKEARKILEENGLDPNGLETVTLNGKKLKEKIFIVPIFYQILKHNVIDKFQARGRGIIDSKTQMPLGGVRSGAAAKTGDGEQATLCVHGASQILKERNMFLSDHFRLHVCNTCGKIPKCEPLSADHYCDYCENRGDKYQIGILDITFNFKNMVDMLSVAHIDILYNTKIKDKI